VVEISEVAGIERVLLARQGKHSDEKENEEEGKGRKGSDGHERSSTGESSQLGTRPE
jgi:ABC-type Zn2+ transport system substrate-binding protein/surface adhesin